MGLVQLRAIQRRCGYLKTQQARYTTLSGLSTRTIQRIESGNKASLESLKALASVFEVSIETLTTEITVIDKATSTWRKQPRWYQWAMTGLSKRKPLAQVEYIALTAGIFSWIIKPDMFATPALLILAYLISKLIDRTDRQKLW